ncbi:uncharacterized protein METZ01_LOCUS327844, partial [marine metagenome]
EEYLIDRGRAWPTSGPSLNAEKASRASPRRRRAAN